MTKIDMSRDVTCDECDGSTVFLGPGMNTGRNYYRCKKCSYIQSRPIPTPSEISTLTHEKRSTE